MRAKDVLLEALQEFTGTVVFVSHDRYFIDKLATRVFEIGDGRVEVFPGNYEDYLWRKSGKPVDLSLGAPVAPTLADVPGFNATPAEKSRVNPMKLRKLKDRVGEIEQEVASAESEIARIETELGDFRSAEETIRLSGLLEEHRKAIESLMAEWEEVSQTIEAAG